MLKQELEKSELCSTREPEGNTSQIGSLGKGRRRFIKTAIVTAPVILTVAGRPVWAGNCSYSGQLSGNLSDSDEPCGGEGCSPGYWCHHLDMWYRAFPPRMLFEDAFDGVDAFPDASLYKVLCRVVRVRPPSGCSFGCPKERENWADMLRRLGRQSVAALQNAATGVSYDLNVAEVVSLFCEAYDSCDVQFMERVKNQLDALNNQGGPC